jgi:hypothetical protein
VCVDYDGCVAGTRREGNKTRGEQDERGTGREGNKTRGEQDERGMGEVRMEAGWRYNSKFTRFSSWTITSGSAAEAISLLLNNT